MASQDLALILKAVDSISPVLKDVADNTDHLAVKSGLASAAFNVAFDAIKAGAEAVAGAFAFTIGKAAEFEAEMSAIKAVTGASADDMEALSAVALQLGKDTAFSALESAQGIEELVKGGVSVADIMGGAAAAALNLAASAGASVADSAALAANAMAEFNLTGEQTAHVADMVAGFANATTGSMEDFKFALSSVGAVANLAGQSFDDTAVAIGLMGKAGILGSDAGTSLKTMLINLSPATNSARDAFKELGLLTIDTKAAMEGMTMQLEARGAPGLKKLADAAKDGTISGKELYTALKDLGYQVTQGTDNFDELAIKMGYANNKFIDAEGNYRSLRDIAQALKEGIEGMGEAQATMALKTAFGTDAVRAAALMAQAGAEGFDDMAEAMGHISAADVAATRLDNLAGKTQALSGSVETAAIIFGTAFLPVLSQLVDEATTFLNTVVIPWAEEHGPEMAAQASAVAAGFLDMVHAVGDIIGAFGGLGDVVAANALQFSILGGFIAAGVTGLALYAAGAAAAAISTGAVSLATGAWTAAQVLLNIALAANPIGLVVMAIAGLVTALVIAYNTNEDFRNAVDTAWAAVQAAAETVFPIVQDAISAVVEVIGNVIEAVSSMPDDVGGKFDELGTNIQNALDNIGSSIGDFFDGLGTIISNAMGIQHAIIMAMWDVLPSDIQDDLGLIADNIGQRFSDFGTIIHDKLVLIATIISDAWQGFFGTVDSKNTEIQTNTFGIWDSIRDGVGGKLAEIVANVGTAFSDLGTTVRAAWDAVATNILEPLAGVLTGIATWVGQVLGAIGGLRDQAILAALDIGKSIMDGIGQGLTAGIQGLKDTAGGAVRGVLEFLKSPAVLDIHSPSGVFRNEIGLPIMQGIVLGMEDGLPQVKGAMDDFVTTVKTPIADVKNAIDEMDDGLPDVIANWKISWSTMASDLAPFTTAVAGATDKLDGEEGLEGALQKVHIGWSTMATDLKALEAPLEEQAEELPKLHLGWSTLASDLAALKPPLDEQANETLPKLHLGWNTLASDLAAAGLGVKQTSGDVGKLTTDLNALATQLLATGSAFNSFNINKSNAIPPVTPIPGAPNSGCPSGTHWVDGTGCVVDSTTGGGGGGGSGGSGGGSGGSGGGEPVLSWTPSTGGDCNPGEVWNGNQCVKVPDTSGSLPNCLPGQTRDASGNCTGTPLPSGSSGAGAGSGIDPVQVATAMITGVYTGTYGVSYVGSLLTALLNDTGPQGDHARALWPFWLTFRDNQTMYPMAAGGIVMSPTMALLGEAGPEAVVPLGRMGMGGVGGVTINVPVTITGNVYGVHDLETTIAEAVQNGFRKGGYDFLTTGR